MRVVCIIQARQNSTRLPNKINADIGGWPMLKHVMKRVSTIGVEWAVATPEGHSSAENDVLGRYYERAQIEGLSGRDGVMRITGDCPLIDPAECRQVVDEFRERKGRVDCIANDLIRTFPDGFGCEVFTFAALEYAHQNAKKEYDREHVTPFIRNSKEFSKLNIRCPINGVADLKLSVDTQEDLDFVRKIDAAKPRDFSLAATLEAIERVKAQDNAQRTGDR